MPAIVRPRPGTTQIVSDLIAEFEKSPPNGLIQDDNPSLSQHVLDVTERQHESRIEPNRASDDIGRKTVTL